MTQGIRCSSSCPMEKRESISKRNLEEAVINIFKILTTLTSLKVGTVALNARCVLLTTKTRTRGEGTGFISILQSIRGSI